MKVAEAFHPSEYIADELKARGWSVRDLAEAMPGDTEENHCAMTLYLAVGPDNPGLRIGDANDLAAAFGTSADLWLNLERTWLEWKGKR